MLTLALTGSAQIDPDNYSTSFSGNRNSPVPYIVAAVPYNGRYFSDIDHSAPLTPDPSASGSLRPLHFRRLNTFDSADVQFFVPGIFRQNAGDYQYRVLQDGKSVLVPWSAVTRFADPSLDLNGVKREFAWLGGYHTAWDHWIVVDVRKKGADSIMASSVVYWMQDKPALLTIYTADELNSFLKRLKRPYDLAMTPAEKERLGKMQTEPFRENNLIFYLQSDVFTREALEYEVVLDGKILRAWGPNDFDNNFIWLKNLKPGRYELNMRFRAQRQNISTYKFEIRPEWQQSLLFKIIGGSLTAAFFLLIALLFRYNSQRKKLALARQHREITESRLQSLRSQLNPHFLFNALSSIQGLVNRNETAAANTYLTEFSSLLRKSISGYTREMIPLETELENTERYLKLEQLRFGFRYTLNVDETVDPVTCEVPAFILQPLVENAIKHAAGTLGPEGRLHVDAMRRGSGMVLCVRDNGPGYDTSRTTPGTGLSLTRERIQLLNQTLSGCSIAMQTDSSAKGTVVSLLFQNWFSA